MAELRIERTSKHMWHLLEDDTRLGRVFKADGTPWMCETIGCLGADDFERIGAFLRTLPEEE